jgi:hypothetical protein
MTKIYVFLVLATLSGLASNVQAVATALTGVSMTLAAADRKPDQVTTAVTTFAFTTTTTVAIAASAGKITITLPASYFSAPAVPTGTTITGTNVGSSTIASCALTAATLSIICIVGGADLVAGSYELKFAIGQLTTGPAKVGANTGLTITTNTDLPNSPAVSYPTLGMTGVSITMATVDKNQLQATTAITTVAFTTLTDVPADGKVTITLPANYFSGKDTPAATLTPASGLAVLTDTCTMTKATLTIICTTKTAVMPAGNQLIKFAAGELTTGVAAAVSSTGLTVKTSVEAVSAGYEAPAIVKAVTGVSITFAAGDRKAATLTAGVTTVSFTTVSTLPFAGSAGKITISLPANYFTLKSSPAGVLVPAAGTATMASCAMIAGALTIICEIASADLAAGAHKITFIAGELTTGAATAGSATGLTVQTATDAASAGAVAPSFSTISDVSITMAAQDKNQLQATTTAVTFSFTTTVLLPFAGSAGKITISLPGNYFTLKTAPVGVLVPAAGTATMASCAMVAATLTIICDIATADLAPGAHKITFAAGELTTGGATASATLTVKTATDAVSAGIAAPALVKAVTGVMMELSVIDRVPTKATSKVMLVSFTTVSTLPFAANAGKITISLPANYFTLKAAPAGVLVPAAAGTATMASCAMTAATLKIICEIATADLAAGAHNITFAAGELTTGAATAVSATGLTVATAVDGASLGASVPALEVPAGANTPKAASSVLSVAFLSVVFAFALIL